MARSKGGWLACRPSARSTQSQIELRATPWQVVQSIHFGLGRDRSALKSAAGRWELGEDLPRSRNSRTLISVLNSKVVPDAARQLRRELQLTHPVAIDRLRAGERGPGRAGRFGMTYDSSVFLVDHLGKVRSGQGVPSRLDRIA